MRRAESALLLVTGRELPVDVDARILDAFGREATSAHDVAAETGTHGPTVARVVRALAGSGVFEPVEPTTTA